MTSSKKYFKKILKKLQEQSFELVRNFVRQLSMFSSIYIDHQKYINKIISNIA